MTDPLSVAGSVAGIVALSGAVSKAFYQFFRSIYDAPSTARDLAGSLYALNIALCQVQESLISPTFVSVAGDEQLESIQSCLASCQAAYDAINGRLERSRLGRKEQPPLKKSWASVQASYTEEQMQDCLQKVEREKATLQLVVSNFSARLQANTLVEVRQLKDICRSNKRRIIKNIHVLVECVSDAISKAEKGKGGKKRIESAQTAAFDLASAYDRSEIMTLQSNDSTPSLIVAGWSEGSISCIWEPPSDSGIELRRIESDLIDGVPPRDQEGFFQSQSRVVPISSNSLVEAVDVAGELLAKRESESDDIRELYKSLENYLRLGALSMKSLTPVWGAGLAAPYKAMYKMLRLARELNGDVFDDLQYIERSFNTISKHWTTNANEAALTPVLARCEAATAGYVQWVRRTMIGGQGKRRAVSDIRMIIKAGPNVAERKRLKSELVEGFEELRDLQTVLAANKMYEMQCEQLSLQKRMFEEQKREAQTDGKQGQATEVQSSRHPRPTMSADGQALEHLRTPDP